jgi:predicted phosphodiesterase
MTKFMFAGDTHGSMPHAQSLIKWAARHEVDVIVQLGDWGFMWPDREKPTRRLERLSIWLDEAGLQMWFLDGNHDNFDWLEEIGAFHAEAPVEVSPNITYLPRGSVTEIDGIKFGALGGAVSIDKEHRTPNDEGVDPFRVSWWHQETIKDADVNKLIAKGKIDVLLSHDAPETEVLHEFLESFKQIVGYRNYGGYKTDDESNANRRKLERAIDGTQPDYVLHGHFHERYNGVWPYRDGTEANVIGLGRDGDGIQSYVILDTADYPWKV